ncbi:DUF262 domain-containing protein [Variovorax ureilyticus]|uniref:DUF262 domain-containing protein n=1 Tax=Variovorax ureilyticus TaxID=1836198 RepID=UPI003D67E0F5
MEVKAQVQNIAKLKDYFFAVPDYQREYVWKVDDQVEQFLVDIDNEFEPGTKEQSSYFIGSIIIVKNGEKYDVIDGQQRLTTIVLTMCAFRDLLKPLTLEDKQRKYLQTISEWLSTFDLESDEVQLRLDLQYEESKDFLSTLIQGQTYKGEMSASIRKMRGAYERIRRELTDYLQEGAEALTEFSRYFLTKIDLVVIESENLSGALKIFETINQRGAGLNAMDLVKNLLFSKAKDAEFTKIKEKWKELTDHLQKAGEDDKPLRFLRYFLMARYHDGTLREDDIYKWIISPAGKTALNYEEKPYALAMELEKVARRYAELVQATGLLKDGGTFPEVTRIGYINKYRSRQHLILLLALDNSASTTAVNYLASQIESFFFFSNSLGIQAKYNERLFAQWAASLRGLRDEAAIADAVQTTILPYLLGKLAQFKEVFLNIRHSAYEPGYRLRFVLGQMENTLLAKAHMPLKGLALLGDLQVEHILPQKPKNGIIPVTYAATPGEYGNLVHRMGNVTLLEGLINQAVNNFNDLEGSWFAQKQTEYAKSSLLSTNLLDHTYLVGKNTAVNRIKTDYGFDFDSWSPEHIKSRQALLLTLAMETWKINGKRLDQVTARDGQAVTSSAVIA